MSNLRSSNDIDFGDPYWIDKYYEARSREATEVADKEAKEYASNPSQVARDNAARIKYDNTICKSCRHKNKNCQCE